ncbi:hypothetical protein AAFF_G00414460 [Aldrovandia affinis]|uniref:Uncharacterized protein n=1 Tax=Aldrovandia affinis TaxID=143900 RepID=A0AAD7SB32_9TELE|nr:hypothetical protein AAFF_G00414460 [Aldrovandia affinis]
MEHVDACRRPGCSLGSLTAQLRLAALHSSAPHSSRLEGYWHREEWRPSTAPRSPNSHRSRGRTLPLQCCESAFLLPRNRKVLPRVSSLSTSLTLCNSRALASAHLK